MTVQSDDVKDILDTDLEVQNIEPFLEDAKGLNLDDTPTAWLAAHLVSMYDKRVDSETSGPIRASFEGKTAMGLQGTRYGQMALIFDESGKLEKMDNGEATFNVY